MQKDPIGVEEGRHMYLYVRGNPVNRIDPQGLKDSPPGLDFKLRGEILGALAEKFIEEAVGSPTGLVCASRFCKRKKASPAWATVFTECTSIFNQYQLPAGLPGDSAALVEECTETCQKITRSAEFKKTCNCREE
jgi:hypothetical protein